MSGFLGTIVAIFIMLVLLYYVLRLYWLIFVKVLQLVLRFAMFGTSGALLYFIFYVIKELETTMVNIGLMLSLMGVQFVTSLIVVGISWFMAKYIYNDDYWASPTFTLRRVYDMVCLMIVLSYILWIIGCVMGLRAYGVSLAHVSSIVLGLLMCVGITVVGGIELGIETAAYRSC